MSEPNYEEMRYVLKFGASESIQNEFLESLKEIFNVELRMWIESFDDDSISFNLYNHFDASKHIDKIIKLTNFDCEVFNLDIRELAGFERHTLTPETDKNLAHQIKMAYRKLMLKVFKDDPEYADILKAQMEGEMDEIRATYDEASENWANEYESYFGSGEGEFAVQSGQTDMFASGDQLEIPQSRINSKLTSIHFRPHTENEPTEETVLTQTGEQMDLFTKGKQMDISDLPKEKKQRGEDDE